MVGFLTFLAIVIAIYFYAHMRVKRQVAQKDKLREQAMDAARRSFEVDPFGAHWKDDGEVESQVKTTRRLKAKTRAHGDWGVGIRGR